MAVRSAINFRLTVIGDGTDVNYAVLVATAPWFITDINPGWQVSQPLPAGVINVSSSDAQAVTAALSALNTLVTFTWPTAIPAGDVVNVYGTFTYS